MTAAARGAPAAERREVDEGEVDPLAVRHADDPRAGQRALVRLLRDSVGDVAAGGASDGVVVAELARLVLNERH